MTIKNSEINSNVVGNTNEIQELRLRLEEAEETLRAIREGEVDGLIINSGQGEQIFTLVGADHSYRMLIEAMNEGALTLTADGIILYCNHSFARMMKTPQQVLIGNSFFNLLYPSDICNLQGSIARSEGVMRREIDLLRRDDSALPVHLSMNSMLVEGKEILSLVITNLTEMKERASELQLANTQLQQEITERQKIEDVLRKSEERFRKSFYTSPILASIISEDDGVFLEVNNAWLKIMGYERQEIIGKNSFSFDNSAVSTDRRLNTLEALKSEDKGVTIDGILYTKSGEERKGIFTSVRIELDGKPCVLNQIVDITERRKAEEALHQSEERFNKAFHSSPTMMAITNMKDGRYVDVNPAWLDVLGFSRSEVFGRTSKDLNIYVAPKQREDVYQYLGESDKLYNVEIQLRTKGGNILTTIASAEIIELGSDRCMLSNTFNITLRKAAEEAMRQSEEKFSKAFHGMPIMMTLATVEDGRFLDANDALCSGTGYSYEEIIGHTSIELNLFPHRIWPDLAVRLVKERRLENYELDLLTKSGEMRNCLCWTQVLHIDRELCHITGMIDVTEQKRVEKEFVRLDRLNLIGEMAGSIGHEIRNPMTAVRGFIQLLNEQECYKKDEIYFDLMIEELDRANGIISEYLGVAKNKPIDLQPQHLNQVINEIYPLIEADANYKGINIKLYLGKPAITRIDKNEIRQLLLNIARNGMEAMSTGGTLTIGTTLAESEIVLFIKDEGQGLPPELQDKLGTPFVTTKENGTGLGLAVCYSIAARHNARMDYETGPTGTTFNIYFPSEDEQITLF